MIKTYNNFVKIYITSFLHSVWSKVSFVQNEVQPWLATYLSLLARLVLCEGNEWPWEYIIGFVTDSNKLKEVQPQKPFLKSTLQRRDSKVTVDFIGLPLLESCVPGTTRSSCTGLKGQAALRMKLCLPKYSETSQVFCALDFKS